MWFFNKAKNTDEINEELNLYKSKKMLEIDRYLFDQTSICKQKLEEQALACAKDLGKYEHEFHSEMESKKIKLAKVQADIEHSEKVLQNRYAVYREMIDEKDCRIKSLEEIVDKLICKFPDIYNGGKSE